MGAAVEGLDRWHVLDQKAFTRGTKATIDVLEPDRMKALVQSVKLPPDVASDQKKSPGGLFNRSRLAGIAIQIAVTPIHRIPGQKTIDAEQLQDQGSGRWKTTDRKSGLGAAI